MLLYSMSYLKKQLNTEANPSLGEHPRCLPDLSGPCGGEVLSGYLMPWGCTQNCAVEEWVRESPSTLQ